VALDEFQRHLQLNALAFAFPASVVLILILGLLEKALPAGQVTFRHVWAYMGLLYFLGLILARRRYP